MTAPTSRLELARRIIDGDVELPGTSAPRMACVLARQELEVSVARLLDERGLRPGRSMRTNLICLREAYRAAPDTAADAVTAWHRLSAACHHHAYELGPTLREASDLVELVAGLLPGSGPRSTGLNASLSRF